MASAGAIEHPAAEHERRKPAASVLSLLTALTGAAWAAVARDGAILVATGMDDDEARRSLARWSSAEHADRYDLDAGLTLYVDPAAGRVPDAALARLPEVLVGPAPEQRHQTPDALQALLDVNLQLQSREFDLMAVFRAIVDHARRLLGTDAAWLGLADEDEEVLRMSVASGIETEGFSSIETPVGEGIGGLAVKEQRTIVVGDFRDDVLVRGRRVRDAVTSEGLISLICAPMLRDGRMLGALYVGNRRTTAFPDADVSLVSALAAQASVAIANAQLYRTVVANNELLERSFAVHEELTELALAAADLDDLGRTIAQLAERSLVITVRGRDAPLQYGPPVADDAPVAATIPIRAGRDDLGTIAIPGARPVSELQRRTVEHGATVVALELVRQQAARDVETRLQAELLDEVLAASPPYDARLVALAQRFDVDLAEPHRLLVVSARGEGPRAIGAPPTLRRVREAVLAAVHRDALAIATTRGERVVVALRRDGLEAWRRVVTQLERALDAAGVDATLGVSAPTTAMGLAWTQASACLRLAEAGSRGAAVSYDDLGPLRFVLDTNDPSHAPEVIRSSLGPLIDYDASTRVPLLPTLKAYLDADGHQVAAAAACYVHVSTLKYRVRRIEAVLDRKLSDPETRFELRLALRLAETLAALGTVVAPSLDHQPT